MLGGGLKPFLRENVSQLNLKEEFSASLRHQHWDGLPWAIENFLVVEIKGGHFRMLEDSRSRKVPGF